MESLFLIAGLGNPGIKYENTRHNVGFDAVEFIASEFGINISKAKHKALIGEGEIDKTKFLLVKPQTFMNLSGESIREIISWYKIPKQNTIIIYDDIDLDIGKLRIRPKGSAGTHNGMKSILYHLQSEDFIRIRIGIGRPKHGEDLAQYVLSKLTTEEKKAIDESILFAKDAALTIIKSNVETAMNKYNK